MNQSDLKKAAALAALKHVVEDKVVGVGSGSTVNLFIDALATIKGRIEGAVKRALGYERKREPADADSTKYSRAR